MNPDGKDLTAQERVVYLREPRRPVFRWDLAGEDVTGAEGEGIGNDRVKTPTSGALRRDGHLTRGERSGVRMGHAPDRTGRKDQ